MSRPTIASALLLAIALVGGCAKEQPPPATTSQTSTSGPGMMGMMGAGSSCPMQVPGTEVQMRDAPDGMSMTFTTTTGNVTEVRNRVRAMADHMNTRSSGGSMMMGDAGNNMTMSQGMGGGHGMMGPDSNHPGMMMGQEGTGAGHGMMGGADGGSGTMMGQGVGMMGGAGGDGSHMMVPVRASAEEVPGGARLRVAPVDASRLEEMRQHMRQHAQMMNEQHRCMMSSATD